MDMNNRILIISNMYPSEKYPHYGIFVENSAKILQKHGYKVDVVFLKKYDNRLIKILFYIKFYIVAFFKIVFFPYSAIYAHYASHTSIPILLGIMLKKDIKLIVNVHGNDVVPEDSHDKKFVWLVKKMLNRADKVVCPSEYFKHIVMDAYNVSTKRICVYPSGGIDTKFFCSMPSRKAREKLKLPNNYRYIGYISRIEKDKGWDIFLSMASQIMKLRDDVKFIVVGDGAESHKFLQKVKELGLENAIFKFPLLSRNDLKLVYNSLDVFVFPTYRKSESLGLVGLEAMACEDVVILPNKYGPTSYEKNMVNSIVFESADADDLYEKTLNALEMDCSNLQIEARKTAEKFDNSNTDTILVDLFDKILS